MSRPARKSFPGSSRRARALGARLKAARLRRRMPETQMAARVSVSRMTIRRLEEGDPTVALAILLRVLEVLNLDAQVDDLAREDELGARFLEAEAPGPRRTSRIALADEL